MCMKKIIRLSIRVILKIRKPWEKEDREHVTAISVVMGTTHVVVESDLLPA